MSDRPNPYAVTTLELADPVREPQGVSRITRWIVYIAQAAMVVAVVFAWIDIETIVASGPVMLGVGLIVTILSWRKSRLRWFGIACLVFPVIVFLIIFLLSWSPSDAQIPIGSLITLFTVAMLTLVLLTDHRPRLGGEESDVAGFGSLTVETSPSEDAL